MIWVFSLYIACRAICVMVADFPTPDTRLSPQIRLSTGASSIFAAMRSTCSRTFSAAFFTAPPEMMVVLEA